MCLDKNDEEEFHSREGNVEQLFFVFLDIISLKHFDIARKLSFDHVSKIEINLGLIRSIFQKIYPSVS